MIAPVLVPVAYASNEPEAAMIRAQLTAVDVACVTKGPTTPQPGVAGACDI
jgi:hypothetical protein